MASVLGTSAKIGGVGALGEEVWIILPAYNEQADLGDALAALSPLRASVVVVDDGSTDETSAVALRHGAWVLRHLFNCGQGAALQTGLDFALSRGAGVLVTFDADGQHAAEDIERLVKPVVEGQVDVALGSRFLGRAVGLPWGRRLVLRLGVWFTRVFSRVEVTDTHNGLRAFSRRAAQQIRITQNRMAHASEILDQLRRHGLRYQEVGVTIRYSPRTLAKGQSSWNSLKIVGKLLLGRLLQ